MKDVFIALVLGFVVFEVIEHVIFPFRKVNQTSPAKGWSEGIRIFDLKQNGKKPPRVSEFRVLAKIGVPSPGNLVLDIIPDLTWES